ncbi:hypothetical protein BGW36DRAFT_320838 [Talaromyces proteolyticus]|uniref:Transcription factor hoxa13 n=1 Tax=Talaromyces proteolyticus TaxID=1131652 RepID=A0AAD4PX56_9EURO|nr:uncharacterized protein BGW36DRAFT_320838 [Talaromyces proteolyticus]KAH8696034.1 hypothetical protein BGW36DRAFT_320838 [Talaromyces proteolyticus]
MAPPEVDKVTNGKPVETSQDKPKTQFEKKKASKPRRGYFRWSLALIVRLFVWYTVLTPFLRCPSNISELDDSSPRVCKPYLIARTYVEPHVEPYYQAYAAPYVDLARPYAQTFNERVYTPVSKVAIDGYRSYGAPALARAGDYVQQQWEAVVVPQLKSAQTKANSFYKNSVDPHVQKAILVVTPYSNALTNTAAQLQEEYLLPIYTRSKPYLGHISSSGQEFFVGTAVPLAHRSWSSLTVFVRGNLLPTITGLYSENVEPQLVKIGERLASYREGRKLRTVVDEFETPPETSSLGAVTSIQKSADETHSTVAPSPVVQETEASVSPPIEQQTRVSREQISSDLDLWQKKFAAAADQGIEDLSQRIEQIVDSQLESGAKKHATALVEALVTIRDHELSDIKTQINKIIGTMSPYEAPEEEEKANEDLLRLIRGAGVTIRDRAHALREWYKSFEEELARRVASATDSTLDVLDGIRDLGLQEIGIRWAAAEGITYKDWEKHHALRKQFDNWRDKVSHAGLNHAKINEAKEVAGDILSEGMAIAEDAAKELSRLKEVGKWKIQAREVGANFEDRTEPPPPLPMPEEEATEEEVIESDDEPAFVDDSDTIKPNEPSVSQPSDDNDTEFVVAGTTTIQIELAEKTPSADDSTSVHFVAEESVAEESSEELDFEEESSSVPISSSKVWGGVAAQVVANQKPIMEDSFDDDEHAIETSGGSLEFISSIASSRLQEGLNAASSQFAGLKASIVPTQSFPQNPVILDAQRRYYEAIGMAHDHYTSFVASASEAVFATPTPPPSPEHIQAVLEDAISQFHQVSSLASSSLTAVIAFASSVEAKGGDRGRPILDDAISKYTNAISAASASLALATDYANSALYSEPTSRSWEDLVSQASEHIYSSPTPFTQQFHDQQGSRFEAVESYVSELVFGKEPDFTESVMSRLRSAYETPFPEAFSSASKIGDHASKVQSDAGTVVEEYKSSISSAVNEAKDEL